MTKTKPIHIPIPQKEEITVFENTLYNLSIPLHKSEGESYNQIFIRATALKALTHYPFPVHISVINVWKRLNPTPANQE